MSATTESKGGGIKDIFLMLVSLAILIGSVFAYYYFEDQSALYRILGVIVAVIVAFGVFSLTAKGKGLVSFLGASRNEVRRMVWPTKQETVQTTLMVFIIVVILAIMLWLFDMLIGYGIKTLLSVGG